MRRRESGPPPEDSGPRRVEAPGTGAMAAGGDIVNSSTHVYQAVPLPRAEEVDPPRGAPPRLLHRTRLFVGRTGKLAELDAALAAPGGAVVQAVHGLGGVGKSTLAAQWAHQHRDEHSLTWWITADSAENITAGLADLAGMLVPELTRDAPAASAVALHERAAWAQRWLAAHTGWLVVLDNVTHPADVTELVTSAPGGRFLITSRLREGWFDIVPTLIELDVLGESEALALLRGIVTTSRPDADLTGDAELCAELGYLPLAIKQAGAYVRQTSVTPERYLELLRANPAVMYDQAARGSDAERTIARIWRITLDTVSDTPLAGHLLRIMAWWAPQAIPRALLDPVAAPAEVTTALGELAAYNMIALDGDSVTAHRLVQAVARTGDPKDPHRAPDDIAHARHQAIDLLTRARPAGLKDPAQWPTWRALLPHIDALADHAAESRPLAVLLHETGLFLVDQGAVHRAIGHLEHVLTVHRLRLGDDHTDTLAARHSLAYAYEAAGDLGQAISLYESTLTARERVLGDDHPDTLASRSNLALAYQALGDGERAVPLLKQVLADRERVLGADDRDTLASRNNLAYAYQRAGDGERAVPLFEQVLADCERVLGADHPYTLDCRNNLAYAHQMMGDPERAISLYESTLTARKRLLGDDHPDTLASHNNLAYAYQEAGNLGRAVRLFKQVVADCERVLGADHPYTLGCRNNLAGAYRAAGNPGRAVPLFERVVTDRVRVLGADHPDTLVSRDSLAYAYWEAGDPERAVSMFEQAMTGCERVWGADHPSTVIARRKLAGVYEVMGDLERAVPMHEQTLTGCERVLGADHPSTLISRKDLARAYWLAGDPGRAVALFEQTLADCVRVLGADHPITRTVRDNLDAARK
jgi:tetratricopeptide (TPR) repeat protein